MITIATSACGAPGVTTSCLGIALATPEVTDQHALLVEADPAGTSLFGGWLRGGMSVDRGLLNLAIAAHNRLPLDRAIFDQAVSLRDTEERNVHGIFGLTDPSQVSSLAGAWPMLGEAFSDLGNAGYHVIIDAGRATQGGFPLDLLSYADTLLLFTTSSLASAVRTAPIAQALKTHMRSLGRESDLALAVVNRGWTRHTEDPRQRADTYPERELVRHLGAPVAFTLPDDPASAAVFAHGAREQRKFDKAALPKALRSAADYLVHRKKPAQQSAFVQANPASTATRGFPHE